MIRSNKCKDDIMKCEEGHCAHHAIIKAEAGWLSEKTFESYSCFISPKIVSGKHKDSHVFNSICKASDRECKLQDSVVVWESGIVYKCGLNWIDKYDFKFSEPFIISHDTRLAFQFTGTTRMCGLYLAKTSEGLYLSKSISNEIQEERGEFEME